MGLPNLHRPTCSGLVLDRPFQTIPTGSGVFEREDRQERREKRGKPRTGRLFLLERLLMPDP